MKQSPANPAIISYANSRGLEVYILILVIYAIDKVQAFDDVNLPQTLCSKSMCYCVI